MSFSRTPGFKLLPDHVIDAVDHRRRLVQEHDLVDVLDLARVEHDLLAVDDLQPGLLQLEEHRPVSTRSTPTGMSATPAATSSAMISSA